MEDAETGFAYDFEIIKDARLGEGALEKGVDEAGLEVSIGGNDGALAMGIADGGLEVFELAAEDLLDLGADHGILCADLATEAKERTTENASAFCVGGGLTVDDVVEVIAEAVERRDLRGEHFVEPGAFGLPIGLDRLGGEGGF